VYGLPVKVGQRCGPGCRLCRLAAHHPFRWAPGQWNEETFVHLDKVLAEAARNNLRVQLCLANWWRDTGASHNIFAGRASRMPPTISTLRINIERAMLFYTNVDTRVLSRARREARNPPQHSDRSFLS